MVTLRDHTDLQALTGELDSVRGFAESLRSQAHEAANRLHTVVSLIELGRTETGAGVRRRRAGLAQQLTDQVVAAVDEPVLAALLLGKTAQASERGVELVVARDTQVDQGTIERPRPGDHRGQPARQRDRRGGGRPAYPAGWSSAPGSRAATWSCGSPTAAPAWTRPHLDAVFRRGWSTKPADRLIGRGLGLALVGQAVRRHDGTVTAETAGGSVFTVRLPERRAAP